MSRTEQEWSEWREGFNSGASLANDFARDLLGRAYFNHDTKVWVIPSEEFETCKDRLRVGLDKGMRLGTRAGLDYYFAATTVENTGLKS